MVTSAEAEKSLCMANLSRNRCHVVLKGTLSIGGQLEAGSLRSMPDFNKDFELEQWGILGVKSMACCLERLVQIAVFWGVY